MKLKILIFIPIVLFAFECSPFNGSHYGKSRPGNVGSNIIQEKDEKEEYEVVIIDPGFNSWMISNSKPVDFYSYSYYQQWNQRYVSAWNSMVNKRAMFRDPNFPFESHINYDPNIDYGIELEYQLFYYFRYVQETSGRRYNFPNNA